MNWLTRKTTEKVQGRAMIYLLLSFCLLFSFLSPLSAKVLVSGEKKNVSEKSRALLPKPVKEAIKSQDKTRGDKKYKIAFGSDEVEIGDSASRKFKPQVKIKRWGEEAYLNVEVDQSNLVSQNDSVNLQADRVGWDSSKVGAGFYKTGARTVKVKDRKNKERALSLSPNGGFEFEVVLYERPQSNVISLPIQSKGLKFYYQKPLTDAEKAQGIIRPDEVSGSYAVYHESKKDGKYNTGKAFQIYRPKIVDANGKWVWGELNIDAETSVLKITIDDSWLDAAAYPVVVDPEFGYTSIGASAVSLEDTLRGTIFTASVFAPTAITAYLENTDASVAHNAKFAIYKISDGQLVDSTQEVSIPASGKGWYDASYLNSFTLSAQQYALVANGDNSNILIYFDDGEPSSGQSLSKSKTYSLGWSDTLTEPSYDDKIYSICGSTGAQISITVTLDTTAPTNQDEVFTESVTKKGGDAVTVVSSADATNNIWFAPAGTTTFTAGETKTTAGGTATSILAPATEGAYKLYVIDAVGNVSNPSTATLTVDNTAPINFPPCGESFTVTHTAGSVAPVTKTVTYGTVETALSGAGKCWITQNLGADHQAVSATDDTEASAGWYWQFNRKQGYKHDGATRTPDTEWIEVINENSDWIPANDPCTIELGAGWRLPTWVEWGNVRSNGNWHNLADSYASDLKVHAAGDISSSRLSTRGFQAQNWASQQCADQCGWTLDITPSDIQINCGKAYGIPLRCIRDIYSNPLVFATSVTKRGEADVAIVSSGDATNTIWFAPLGTTVFSTGKKMRMASGTATSIQAPEDEGEYKLYILDAAGNVSAPSSATLTVDNTAPTNQDAVFPADAIKQGGKVVTINSSEDATNIIWFLPEDLESLTEIVPGPTITTATGTATTILSPASEGRYKLYVQDQAGNMSAASNATLTVDNTAPVNTAFSCGSNIVKSHATSGGVAPANKMITYGTVATDFSGDNKCWITKNLGADQVATAISGGATQEEILASAGWFWEYNKKVGHMVNSDLTITPVWPAFTGFSSASDWNSANDPCALELGAGWRLPTTIEWQNVVNSVSDTPTASVILSENGIFRNAYMYFYVYSYVTIGADRFYQKLGEDSAYVDDYASRNFNVNVSWPAKDYAQGYYLYGYISSELYTGYFGMDVGAVTSLAVDSPDLPWTLGDNEAAVAPVIMSSAQMIATSSPNGLSIGKYHDLTAYIFDYITTADSTKIYSYLGNTNAWINEDGNYQLDLSWSFNGFAEGYFVVIEDYDKDTDATDIYYGKNVGSALSLTINDFEGWSSGSRGQVWPIVTPSLFDSVLKLHYGGVIYPLDEQDPNNGVVPYGQTMLGGYWSSTQYSEDGMTGGQVMVMIDGEGTFITGLPEFLGGSARCIHDTESNSLVFGSSVTQRGGTDVAINSSGDATNILWFAPSGTTTFAASATMTTAGGTATSILAPLNEGAYKMYIIDAAGNVSAESAATLTVDNTAPTNQDTVFPGSVFKKGDVDVTIVSSDDATNNVWFAPAGTTTFAASATMTTAAGNATSIKSPANEGEYKLYVIDLAGNVSSPSTATLTVDNTPPTASVLIAYPLVKNGALETFGVNYSEPMARSPQPTLAISGAATLTPYNLSRVGSGEQEYLARDIEIVGTGDGTATITLTGQDLAGNDLVTTPTSGATFTVDNTAPTVNGVTSTLANGTYKAGQVIPITITFSEPVTVTGSPQLSLATSYPETTMVNYASGSGTTELTFNYTVALGNESADLDYSSTSALTLNDGTIKDAAGNNATLTLAAPGAAGSLGANKAIVIAREFLVTYTVKDSVIGSILSAVNLKIYNSSGTVVYNQTKDGVFNDIVLDYAAAGYVFQTTKDAYVSKSETKIPTSLEDVVDGTTDNTIHWTGYMTSLVEASADYQVKSSFTYIEPTYESDGTTLKSGTDVLNIKLWLERRGKMITNTAENLVGDATVEIYNDATGEWNTLTFNSATDPGQNNDSALAESARVGFYQKSIPYVTTIGTPKLLTLEAGKTYFARCKIPWGGTSAAADTRYTYQGGTTFTITVSEKLKEVTDAIKTQILNTQTLVSSEAATTRSAVTTAGAAVESKVGTEANSIRESIAGVKEETAKILTATGSEGLSTKIDEIKTQVVDQVKPFVKSGIINRESSVKIGSAVTIRYRTETGLAPKLNVYSPKDVLLVTSKAMTEVGTTGIYEASVTFLDAWGTGDFSVVCSESTKGTVDATVISVKDVDISDVSGTVSAVLGSTTGLTGMNKIVGDMGNKFTDMDKLLSKMSADMAGKLGDTKAAANDMLTAFKQIEDISKQIKEISGGTGINLEKLYAVSQDKKNDITYIKNKSEELKAAMDLNQKLMQGVANKPVVETWFEYK